MLHCLKSSQIKAVSPACHCNLVYGHTQRDSCFTQSIWCKLNSSCRWGSY